MIRVAVSILQVSDRYPLQVTFGRFPHSPPISFGIQHQDVHSRNPLVVKVRLPENMRIGDMGLYAGMEVQLMGGDAIQLPSGQW